MGDDGYTWLHDHHSGAVLSLSERAAESVRAAILVGRFLPGERLSEPKLVDALSISRNTLREAFRVLAEERLVEHRFNRGVFVRVPRSDDVSDLYACRRVVECAPLRAEAPRRSPQAMADAISAAIAAQQADDANGLAAADIRFHIGVTELNGSVHLDRQLRPIWNEMRLVFLLAHDSRGFHDRYVGRNTEILQAYRAGEAADGLMDRYLRDAERELLAALDD